MKLNPDQQHFYDCGNKIRKAFVAFREKHSLSLKTMTEKVAETGYEYSQTAKWFPAKINLPDEVKLNKVKETVLPAKIEIVDEEQLHKLITRLIKLLAVEKYVLLDAIDQPVNSVMKNDPMCFYDEKTGLLRYKKENKAAALNEAFKSLFDIREEEEIDTIFPHTDSFLIRYEGGKRGKMISYFMYWNKHKKTVLLSYEDGQKINGKYAEQDKDYIISLDNKKDELYCQLVFPRSESGKEFLVGTFSKYQELHGYPSCGIIVAVQKKQIGLSNMQQIRSACDYFLFDSRKDVSPGKYFIKDLLEKPFGGTEDPALGFYYNLQPYIGTYEGYFINPHRKRFENCQVSIYPSGRVIIWVHAKVTEPYKGIARKSPKKDLMFIKFEYIDDIGDYRAFITLDTSGNNGKICTETTATEDHTMYGVMGGFTRDVTQPAGTRVALRKRSHTPEEYIEKPENEDQLIRLKETYLNTKTKLKELKERLEEENLKEYFYGKIKEEYSSIALLMMMDPDEFMSSSESK